MTHILEEGPSMHALVPKFEESYKMKKDGHKVIFIESRAWLSGDIYLLQTMYKNFSTWPTRFCDFLSNSHEPMFGFFRLLDNVAFLVLVRCLRSTGCRTDKAEAAPTPSQTGTQRCHARTQEGCDVLGVRKNREEERERTNKASSLLSLFCVLHLPTWFLIRA